MHVVACAILLNTATQTYHPILYRDSPLPGGVPMPRRLKSIGHHTEGFPTFEAAVQFLQSDERTKDALQLTDAASEWDGEGLPADVIFM